jgi:hypothetical protein
MKATAFRDLNKYNEKATPSYKKPKPLKVPPEVRLLNGLRRDVQEVISKRITTKTVLKLKQLFDHYQAIHTKYYH